MKPISIFSLCLFISISFINLDIYAQDEHKKKIVGYILGSNVEEKFDEISPQKLTHINYAFANIKDGKIVAGNPKDKKRLEKINLLKKDNPDLKILISVSLTSYAQEIKTYIEKDSTPPGLKP